jgi:hypothetical protein
MNTCPVELSSLVDTHLPIFGDILNILHIFNNNLELVVSVAEFKQSLECHSFESTLFVKNAENVKHTI